MIAIAENADVLTRIAKAPLSASQSQLKWTLPTCGPFQCLPLQIRPYQSIGT